jgi:integrase
MLTELTIGAKLAKPPAVRVELPDKDGLYLVQQPSGAASWALRYRANGKPRKLTLGSYPAVGLKDARRLAARARGSIADGKDPAGEKTAAKAAQKAQEPAADAMSTFAETFLKRHVQANCGRRWSAESERLLRKEILPSLGSARLSELTRSRVHDLLDSIADRPAPIIANRVLAVLKSMCSFAVERGVIPNSPLAGMKMREEKARDRVLTDDELARVWRAAETLKPHYGPALRMLILTGQRLGEVSGMRRSEVAGDTWTLPADRAKNGVAHTIPLTASSRALMPSGSGDMVFGPLPDWGRAKAALDAASGVTDWRLHDVRRTVATNFQKLGIRLEVTEAILNHVSGSRAGIVGVYQRHDWADEKRQALDAWARRLETIVGGKAEDNVVPIRSRGETR